MHILYKHPVENRNYDFDFAEQKEIMAGQTIDAAEVTVVEGSETLVVGTPNIVAKKVFFDLTLGEDKDNAFLECKVTTNLAKILIGQGILRVRAKLI